MPCAVKMTVPSAICEALHPVRFRHQADTGLLQLAGGVLVVDQVAEHRHRLAVALGADLLGQPDRLDHAVAVATGADAYDLHPDQSTRGPRSPLDR
jgi:hypothetical protein